MLELFLGYGFTLVNAVTDFHNALLLFHSNLGLPGFYWLWVQDLRYVPLQQSGKWAAY